MNNYKINLIYNEDSNENINNIIIRVLKREITNHFKGIYKNNSLSGFCKKNKRK